MTPQRYILGFLVLCTLVMLGIGPRATAQQAEVFTSGNLLVNGNFDELPFYWAYPNHFIPGGWERWWIHGTVLPEFDDIKGGREHIRVDGDHALVYFKWGANYTAGVFQVVHGLTPCRPYELTMYARTHTLAGALPHARIGLDPVGQQLTPDGAVHDPTPLHRTIWSREQTELFKWEELSVTAEPLGNSLTAILYASPQPGSTEVHYYDTFWDAGALQPVPYVNERLPAPLRPAGNFIYNVNSITSTEKVTLTWNLQAPGTSQIWYTLITPSTITDTTHLTHTYYLPIISRFSLNFEHATPVNYNAGSLTRTATLTGFTPGQIINYIIVTRRLVSNTCVTEYAGPYTITTHP